MKEGTIEQEPGSFWIISTQLHAWEKAKKFTQDFQVERKFGFNPFETHLFQLFFTAYSIKKDVTAVSIARSNRDPINETLLRIPIIRKIIHASYFFEKVDNTAAEEVIAYAKSLATEQQNNEYPTEWERMLKPWRYENLPYLTTGDPFLIQNAANMLTALYYQEGVDLESRKKSIEEYLTRLS